MGFSQKQAVAVLYIISAILGLSAVVLTTIGAVRAILFLVALCVAGAVAANIYLSHTNDSEPLKDSRPSTDSQAARPRQSRPTDTEKFFGEKERSDK